MSALETKTVREIAIEHPSAPAALEHLGIDYCCGGKKPLAQACMEAGLDTSKVVSELDAYRVEFEKRKDTSSNWGSAPLADLIHHIEATHHAYVRRETERLTQLSAKVALRHGANHPNLAQVETVVRGLAEELTTHLMKEEHILFPYIIRMEQATLSGQPVPPAMFGTVENPIRMMEQEHEDAGVALRTLRELTDNYSVPADACTSWRALYTGLLEFEADLHQHIHLENNLLFPHALELYNR